MPRLISSNRLNVFLIRQFFQVAVFFECGGKHAINIAHDFSIALSHQLRNPMQAAALQLELLAVGQGRVGVRQFERRALRLRAGILAPGGFALGDVAQLIAQSSSTARQACKDAAAHVLYRLSRSCL